MLDYMFRKSYDDYNLVSLDGSIGYFLTNVSLVCELWIRRIGRHLRQNGYKFNIITFIRDHPIHNENQ